MKKANFAKLVLIGLLVTLAVSLVIQARQQSNGAQTPPPQGQNQQPPPEPKNLQVLKGMNGQQVNQVMHQWESETGAGCNFCHIRPFEQDTPRKNVARWMQTQYVEGLKHKDGSAVSCKDCHQSEINPLRTQPFIHAVGQDRKGLIVLKGMAHDALMAEMQGYTKALNVKCDYCHTNGDFGEDTPKKEIARYMITMFTGNLTKDGKAVTCNDCHQGRAKVLSRLPRPQGQQQRPPANPEAAPKKPIE